MDRAKERGGTSAVGLKVHPGEGCRSAGALFPALARQVLLLLLVAAVAVACGSTTSSSDGGGGGAGGGGTTGSGGAAGSTGTGGAGGRGTVGQGGGAVAGISMACQSCAVTNCSTQLIACAGASACQMCVMNNYNLCITNQNAQYLAVCSCAKPACTSCASYCP